jgi:hypothetical protein
MTDNHEYAQDASHQVMQDLEQVIYKVDVDPVARMESFRALKLSRLESFRVQKSSNPNGVFSYPKTLRIGEF